MITPEYSLRNIILRSKIMNILMNVDTVELLSRQTFKIVPITSWHRRGGPFIQSFGKYLMCTHYAPALSSLLEKGYQGRRTKKQKSLTFNMVSLESSPGDQVRAAE